MGTGYLFYDTETTGIDTTFDQILQFGAIRTDDDLNELERLEVRCRLLPYVVPAPGAMLVTGVTVEVLTDPNLPSHYEMIQQVRTKLDEWSPATFIGHNSMSFDENLLRQALYKNLYSPYVTNVNGNGRADSLTLCHAFNVLTPGLLTIPLGDNGKPSFKLDRLAPANGFDHSNAHDAMADVEATIHICRLLKDGNPELWSAMLNNAKKSEVLETLHQHGVLLNINAYFGRAYTNVVTQIGENPENSSEKILFNLALDPNDFVGLSQGDLSARLAKSPKPVRSLRANACPILVPLEVVSDEVLRALPDARELAEKAVRIAEDQALCGGLVEAYLEDREPFEPSEHVEGKIYEGFISSSDQELLDRFHLAPWELRAEILSQLSDIRLRTLGQRLIYSEAPEAMSDDVRRSYESAIAERLLADADDVPWQTLPQAISDAEAMLATAEGEASDLLNGALAYLRARSEQLGSIGI